ncbi:hypothetical protein RF182_21780, partial [Escherichia coli]|nr:hypothetical protein [Escherichia coli]
SSLDFGHQIQLLDTLAQLKNNGMTMLMSTHHPLHANAIADSIIQVEPVCSLLTVRSVSLVLLVHLALP